jgi:DNA-binding SARP family transcriptional activator/tetratricopeptide (TPR) repeat protein
VRGTLENGDRVVGHGLFELTARGKRPGLRDLRIDVLGPLTVTFGAGPPPVFPHGQRVVLGLLAVSAGSPVRLDSIVDVLWGDKPPVSAVGIVQTYVSRLRQVLGADLLPRDAAGYRLVVTGNELDLLAFREAVKDAQSALEPEVACAGYERALGLWRDDPLPDVDVLRGHPVVVALAGEFASAVLEYADAAAACGRHEQVLPRLRALAARDELDEASRSRLMIALAGTGRQAEALTLFEEVRQRLDQELGMPPGPGLREAHAKVLRQDLAPDPALAPPGWLPLFQLPAAPADFTGRAADVARLSTAIEPGDVGVPIAIVSGQPGVGKTSLALHAAHLLRARFPDGQLWVHLAGTSPRPRDPAEVLGEFLRALGMHGSAIPENLSERTVCYRSRLAGRRILVVADDAASAAQIRPLLPGTAGCALLVTSRSHLEDMDGAELIPLDVMSEPDAAALLTRLVGADRVTAERDAVSSLIRSCGALPLALRIAGAKLAARPLWSLSLMVHRLTGLGELESGDMSVRASIDSSYTSLSDRARKAFRLLALAGPGDFAEWVAAALLGEPDAADVLAELAGRSLVISLGADPTGEPRYRLHDLLGDYAAERLADDPGRGPARDRLLNAWLQLAMLANAKLPAEPYFPPDLSEPCPAVVSAGTARRLTADPIGWFTTERTSLLAAVEQACAASRLDLARALAAHQRAYQHLQYRQDDVVRLWRLISDRAEQFGEARQARQARVRMGASYVLRGQPREGAMVLDRCLLDDPQGVDAETAASALEWRATGAVDIGEYAAAREYAERGVQLARRAGSLRAEYGNLSIQGSALAWLGEYEQAVAACEQALDIAMSLATPACEIVALLNLASAYVAARSYHRAILASQRAMETSRRIVDVCSEALAAGMLADAYLGLGRYQEAADSLLRALPIFQAHAQRRFHGVCLLKLGYAYEAMGSPEAAGYLEESLRIFTELRLPQLTAQASQALDRCGIARSLSSGRR